MIPKQDRLKILEQMAQIEEVMRDLYNICARKFPEHLTFFHKIAADETGHAAWLRELMPLIEEEAFTLDENRFTLNLIEKALAYTRSQVAMAEDQRSDIVACLATAVDLEKGMLEDKYYQVIKDDAPEMQSVFKRLAEGTRGHRKQVQEMLDMYRKIKS